MLCAAGRDYKDPGGFSLISGAPEKDRPVNVMGFDRDRVKPFAAYSEDLRKAVGRNPASLNGAATTFGNVPDRWFEEPSSSAIGLFTAYRIAFDGCQGLVNDAAVRRKTIDLELSRRPLRHAVGHIHAHRFSLQLDF